MDYQQYMITTNNWTSQISDSIWWDVHSVALNSIGHRQSFIHKFIHGKLPCNYQQHKYYQYKSPIGKSCNIKIETQQYIITCTGCSKRVQLRKKYLLELNTIMTKYRTSAATQQVISHHFNRLLTNQAPEEVQRMIPDATNTLLLASQQQGNDWLGSLAKRTMVHGMGNSNKV
jgi:hypothetical protein